MRDTKIQWDPGFVGLSSLSGQLDKQNLQNLLEEINKLHGRADMEFADSVLEVSIQDNFEVVEHLRGMIKCARH